MKHGKKQNQLNYENSLLSADSLTKLRNSRKKEGKLPEKKGAQRLKRNILNTSKLVNSTVKAMKREH